MVFYLIKKHLTKYIYFALSIYVKLSDKNKSNIEWMLSSFNPEPLEFYRYLNRKTKRIATNAYFDALSFVLKLSERIPKERMALFQEIQEKWKVRT